MNLLRELRASAVAAILLSTAQPAFAQTGQNVLVVANDSSPISVRIAEYYAGKRGIPSEQLLRLKMPLTEQIARPVYNGAIEAPLAQWFGRNAAQDRILYIVLAKDVPLRIEGTSERNGTVASVDSELALLYRKLTGRPVPIAGPVQNPYFLGANPLPQAQRFSHEFYDVFLVTRLDGYTEQDVTGLIDRGLNPSKNGKIVLDQRVSVVETANEWLKTAADRLKGMGFSDRVLLETTGKVVTGETNVLGYYSWGSNDPAIRVRHFGFQFAPGALAAMFVSSDGRTFKEPPAEWKIGSWEDPKTFFGGSPQSMAGDLIRDGVTGIAGHVAEPYLDATIHPEILFPEYIAGFNLAESFYLAMPYLSWQTVVVGDPLCGPFRANPLTTERIVPAIDPITEAPRFFSNRRLDAASVDTAGVRLNPDAVKYLIKAETHLAKNDVPGAEDALKKSAQLDDRFTGPRLALASIYEQQNRYDEAAERYRQILETFPNHPIALNNLAYHMAVREHAPEDALPLAKRAYEQIKNSPDIADTLGWIYHLAGDENSAERYLGEAVNGAPTIAEFQIHLAAIQTAEKKYGEAEKHLNRALELAPGLASRPDVKALRAGLPN